MAESRYRWVILIILAFVVVSGTILIPVVIASDYYQNVTNISEWTPIANANPTATQTKTPEPTGTERPAAGTPTEMVNVNENCTYTSIYWVYHQEAWPSQIIIGELNYTKEEAIAYIESPDSDTPVILFIQLHTTFLNLLSGADPESIEQTMVDASLWLSEHPIGSVFSELDRQDGLAFVRILEDYNNGITGPGQCEEEPIIALPTDTPDLALTSIFKTEMAATATPSLTPTPSPTPTFTLTSTRAATAIPKWTSTPTKKPSKPDKPKPPKEPRPTDPPDD